MEWVKSEIEKIESYMRAFIPKEPKIVYEPLFEYLFRGGKRIRPLFLVTLFKALTNGKELEEVYKIGAVLELFHNFTLIHDDIEDNSDFRRGKPTLHRTLGVPVALNTGDALYTVVWRAMLDLELECEKRHEVMLLLQRAFQRVVEGQGIELGWYLTEKFDVSVGEYYEMVKGKTAALFGCACALAYYFAGKEQEVENAYRFGEQIGIAFQIQDDILNIAGDFEKYKKEIGGDISEGKRTLLTISALSNAPKDEAEELLQILKAHTKDHAKILRAIELIKKNGGLDFAKKKAEEHIEQVKEYLTTLPENIWSKHFEELVWFVVRRDH